MKCKEIEDIKVVSDTNRLIACGINGNYVDVWGFKLDRVCVVNETILEIPDADDDQPERALSPFVVSDSGSNDSTLKVTKDVENFESVPVSKISNVSSNAEHSVKLIPREVANETITKTVPETNSKSDYIPVADGSKTLNVDMSTFIKHVFFVD